MLVKRNSNGFTVIELLIAIVIIGIIAGITLVAYNGVQNRARASSSKATLSNISKQLALYKVDSGSTYPEDLSDIPTNVDDDVTLEYSTSYGDNGLHQYCATATVGSVSYHINSESTKPMEGKCSSHSGDEDEDGGDGEVVDDGNLALPLSAWTITDSGVSYDSSSKELSLTRGVSGSFRSPTIPTNNASSVTVQLRSYSTVSAPYQSPRSGLHTYVAFLGEDGVTRVKDMYGNEGNGNAKSSPLNEWFEYSNTYPLGSNVKNIFVAIYSSDYTSNNIIKDIEVTLGN